MRVIFKSKKFNNYSLFRNLLLISIIIENPTLHKVVKRRACTQVYSYAK